MHNKLATRSHVRARNSIFDSVKDGCWLYRWLQVHSFILFFKVLFRPLIKQDMFNAREKLWPETNYVLFGRRKKNHPDYPASKIIFDIIKVDMTIACVLAFLEAGFGFSGPIILKYILKYLNSSKFSDADKASSFGLAGLWILFCVIRIILKQNWSRLANLCATQTEVILDTQFYRKTMRISTTYKKYMHLGDFYSFYFVDAQLITSWITSFPNIVAAPTTLILSVIFVCIEVGAYGLLLLAVIALAITIELLIDMEMVAVSAHKVAKYDLKLVENMHMYKQFKQLKSLAWESLIINQNVRYRIPQNALNKVYYILGQVYLCITNFAPVLVIFILLVVGEYSNNQTIWGTTIVFTVIGYISTISTPLKNLPNVIGKMLMVRKIFQRIQNFLDADQLLRTQDIHMQQGMVKVKNLILSVGTRDSIDRLIARQSIMVEEEHSMMMHMKHMPIEVRLYHSLDFMNREELKKFRKLMKCVEIPFKLNYKKGDVVILLGKKSGSGKTSFIRGFLGSLDIQAGYLKYNGRIGYVSANDFHLTKSIRENVLFGEPLDQQRLRRAYRLSELDSEIEKFVDGDKTIVDNSTNVVAQSQKCLISLARAIYYDCDIVLMDDVFHEFQIDELQVIYDKICNNLRDKLIFISTNLIHFLRLTDNVVILEDRRAVEVGTFGELKQNSMSKIHHYKITDIHLIHYRSLISKSSTVQSTDGNQEFSKELSIIQRISQSRVQTPQVKISKTRHEKICTVSRIHTLYNEHKHQELEPPLPPTQLPVKRPGGPATKYFLKLFKHGGFAYLATFIFIALANAVAVFSTWLIGSLTRSPFGLPVGDVLLVYACLQIIYGILLLIYGIFIPSVAKVNIETMHNEYNGLISRTKLEQFQKFSNVHLSNIYGPDNYGFFMICDNVTNVFNASVTLGSTVIIMGLASYYIFIVAGAVGLYCLLVFYFYRFTYNEVYNLGGAIKKYFFRALEDSVVGTETFQYYDKVEWFRMRFYDGIYMFRSIWKVNVKYLYHAFNIFCGMAQIFLITGILMLAISKKQKFTPNERIYVNVALSTSPKILGSIFSLLNNLANMGENVHTVIVNPSQSIKGKQIQNYDQPCKPSHWPWNGRIELRNVTIQKKELKKPLLDSISLTVESGEVVGIYSDYDSDVSILFSLICGLSSPQKNNGEYAGEVLISDVDIATFGQIYTTQTVVLLDQNPVCFNGTVRFNVDPFYQYSDEEIEEALEVFGFWNGMLEQSEQDDRMVEGFKTLDFMIEERGEQLPTGAVQKLNFARAFLKKPKVLLLQRAFSKIDVSKIEDFYFMARNVFRNCTIIMITLNLNYLMRCDRLICLKEGKIYEAGTPRRLATNPKTRLYQMIKVLAQSEYVTKQSKISN